MSREEFIGKLQMCYFGERNALNEILSIYDELVKENENLKHNQNELKRWLEEEIKSLGEAINEERDYELVNEFASRCNNFEEILNKMHGLRGGNNDC